MVRKIQIGLFLTLTILTCNSYAQDCVILLHGLMRTHRSMSSLEYLLKSHRYYVVNEDYPSSQDTIENLAQTVLPAKIDRCLAHDPERIHVVTHSLGGIILQEYLRHHEFPKLHRVVMMGPPNHGSELANFFHKNIFFKLLYGPVIAQLTTRERPIVDHDLSGRYELGIIAGNYSFLPFNQTIFQDANDGVVKVSSARLDTANDFITLPAAHSVMMNNRLVQKQVLHFIKHGQFNNS